MCTRPGITLMKTIQTICVCALLLASTGMAVCAIQLLQAATAAVAALPSEVSATRIMLGDQVRAARQDVLVRTERQIAALRHDVMNEAGELRQTADRRMGDTLARADAALATADGMRRDLQPVIGAAQATLLSTQATLLSTDRTVLDLRPQLLGLVAASKVTAGETAQTMRDVRGAVPGFLSQGQIIAGNVNVATERFSGIADNLNRLTKPKWYDRLIGYGLNGLVMYRNLNPITNLTVKGAQFLTSRP